MAERTKETLEVSVSAHTEKSLPTLSSGDIVYNVRTLDVGGDWAAPRLEVKVGLLRVGDVSLHQWDTKTGEKVMFLERLSGGFACHSHNRDGIQVWFRVTDASGPEIPESVLRDWTAIGGMSADAAKLYRDARAEVA